MNKFNVELDAHEANACLAAVRTIIAQNPHTFDGKRSPGFTIEVQAVNALLDAERKLSNALAVDSDYAQQPQTVEGRK